MKKLVLFTAINMKTRLIIGSVILISLSACSSGTSDCIQGMMNQGYSYEEAKEGCEEAQIEGQLQD